MAREVTDNSKVKKGEELITVLREILEDNSKILANQEAILSMLRKEGPRETFVRC